MRRERRSFRLSFRASVLLLVAILVLLGGALVVEAVFDSAAAAWVALVMVLAFLVWRLGDGIALWWSDDS